MVGESGQEIETVVVAGDECWAVVEAEVDGG